MITINSFLHRDRLRDLVRRWLLGELRPGDADEILRLVHFNNVFVSRSLARFADGLFATLHGDGLQVMRVSTKGELRDRITRTLPVRCDRCAQLVAAYRRDPGYYFRDTPFHGSLYFRDGPTGPVYTGSYRVKRIRRLAEKIARRLVDWLQRDTVIPADASTGVWREAMQRVQARLRGEPPPDGLVINDVAGLKVILAERETGRLAELLVAGGCRLVEEEHHAGDYRATNLVVDCRPDTDAVLGEPLHARMLAVFEAHGYDARRAAVAFREFVQSGEERISLEIIVTSYPEMLESEIGRCMHEERIIRQRHDPRYHGQLAQNVEFLMEFLFTFPALPGHRLERLPVRIDNRYLPDSFDEIRRRLFGNPSVELNEL
jgi:hypothetical protein